MGIERSCIKCQNKFSANRKSVSRLVCLNCLNPDGTITWSFVCAGCSCSFNVNTKGRIKRSYCSISCKNAHEHASGLRRCPLNDETPMARWTRKFGADEAKRRWAAARTKIGSKMLGSAHPRWGAGRSPEYIAAQKKHVGETTRAALKGKTLEEIHGSEAAAGIKAKISASTRGENNPMFGKPAPAGCGGGYKGWYLGRFFRSLLELSYMVHCEAQGVILASAERSDFAVAYVGKNGQQATYFPDYVLPDGTVVEVKPASTVKWITNQAKFTAARAQFQKFEIKTELDFDRLDRATIRSMIDAGAVKLTARTSVKFNDYWEKLGIYI